MRDQANLVGDNPKWIVLDGDIDPMCVGISIFLFSIFDFLCFPLVKLIFVFLNPAVGGLKV